MGLIRYACMIIRFRFPCLRDFIFLGMNGEWPMAGVDLGFHPVSRGDPYPPAVAHQLHQLYQDTFAFRLGVYSRHHYCNQLEYVHTTGQRSSLAQPQALQRHYQVYQPTEAYYQGRLLWRRIFCSGSVTYPLLNSKCIDASCPTGRHSIRRS